jgi:hypothetical protein
MDTPNQIQGLPAGFTVDSDNSEPSTSQTPQVQGLPSGFTVDDTTPGPPSSNPKAPFQGPSGKTFTPGQQVQHSSGATGIVTGQDPVTQKAKIQWAASHPGQPYGVEGSIRANDPKNVTGKVARWAEQVQNDIKYGTDFTGVGQFIKKMGAHGVYTGNSQGVGDFLASIPLGLLSTVKGQAEMAGAPTMTGATPTGKTNVGDLVSGGPQTAGGIWQGVKDFVGGEAQVGTMPGMVIGGPETGPAALEAGADALKAGGGATADAAKAVGGKVADVAGAATRKGAGLVQSAVAKGAEIANAAGEHLLPDSIYPEAQTAPTADDARKLMQKGHDQHILDIRQHIGQAVDDAGLTMEPANSIQKVPVKATEAFDAEASRNYNIADAAVEKATGKKVDFQKIDAEVEKQEAAVADAKNVEEEAFAQQKLNAAKNTRAQIQATLKNDPEAAAAAKKGTAMYKQARAMEDLGKKIQGSTQGLPVGEGAIPERVEAKPFGTQLRNLQNDTRHGSDRLAQALGKENSKALIVKNNQVQAMLQRTIPDQLAADKLAAETANAKRAKVQSIAAKSILPTLGAAGGVYEALK